MFGQAQFYGWLTCYFHFGGMQVKTYHYMPWRVLVGFYVTLLCHLLTNAALLSHPLAFLNMMLNSFQYYLKTASRLVPCSVSNQASGVENWEQSQHS